jgi:hypothetical protein
MKKILIFPILILTISGCRSSHKVYDDPNYTSSHNQVLKKANTGRFKEAFTEIKQIKSDDKFLHTLDSGMLAHRSKLFNDSENIYGKSYQELKIAAEDEIESSWLKTGVQTFGKLTANLLGNNLIGTGTYRYAYGMQLYSFNAKYVPSVSEIARLSFYQTLNTMELPSNNKNNIARQNLIDISYFIKKYNSDYKFLDNSAYELLLFFNFLLSNDTSGSDTVAINNTLDELINASNNIASTNEINSKVKNIISCFDGAYQKGLKTDLFTFQIGKGKLTYGEVVSTRLVSQSEYNRLKSIITSEYFKKLSNAINEYKRKMLKDRIKLVNKLKEDFKETNNLTPIVFELGNAPNLRTIKSYPKMVLINGYKPAPTTITLEVESNNIKQTINMVNFLDIDLIVQLDYLRFLDLICSDIITNIRAKEKGLCLAIKNYKVELYNYRNHKSKDSIEAAYYALLISNLIASEPARQRNAFNNARNYLMQRRFDMRTWQTQPNKIYIGYVKNIPKGEYIAKIPIIGRKYKISKKDNKVIIINP